MAIQTERMSANEIIRRGEEIYKRRIQADFETANLGRLVGIDVFSEEFEIGDNSLDITLRIRHRAPSALIALLRIGGGAVDKIGPRYIRETR
jgi:hypothetical protein